jgi:DNA-binding MarR family transcriptional regulator
LVSAIGDGAVGSATEVQKERWKAAMPWRRAIEGALRVTGLTFTQWLVLDALRELIAETREAAIQSEAAARVGLDPDTISLLMRTLAEKWLVDREPDSTGRAWRVLSTDRAERLLRDAATKIEAASALSVSPLSGPLLDRGSL